MVCLTFDIEEFDTPKVDYNVPLPLARQIKISADGTIIILDLLSGLGVKATFFVTAVFAENRPDLVRRMVREGHEVSSHSYDHSNFRDGDYLASRLKLEEICGQQIVGYRSPRMGGADAKGLAEAGYLYDSSLNPCYLPGKYNNFKAERRIYNAGHGVTEIPASVATALRIPLFWLSLHLLPLTIYGWLARRAIKENGFLNIYFHPWEFSDDLDNNELQIPFYIRYNSGEKLVSRLARLIASLKEQGAEFGTLKQLITKQ